MSELSNTVISLKKCKLRRLMLLSINIFKYEIKPRTGSLLVNSRCVFNDAVEEGFRNRRRDIVKVFVNLSRDEESLKVIIS